MPELRSINPTDGSVEGSVKISTKADIEAAVKTARQGFSKWRQKSLLSRCQIVNQLAPILKKDAKKLAELMAKEMGKPLIEAEGEIALSVDYVSWYCREGAKILKDEVLKKDGQIVSLLRYDPLGVVAVIKPWNFPILTPIWSLIPALISGNSVIYKPSEYVPLTSRLLIDQLWQAGVPKDVLQILYGRAQLGQMLVDSPIDMVSFTGSTGVGQEIAQKCSARFVKYVLELGGSSAGIVAKDADLNLAVDCVLYGRFSNCGQDCLAIKRLFIERPVYNKFIKNLTEKIKALRVGNPLDKTTDIGPLVSEVQLKKLENQVTKGVVQSGRIIAGGRRLRGGKFSLGYFHEPTLMIHVHSKMDVMQEETFGPLLPVYEVDSFSQGIRLANQTKFGLTAVVFTRSKDKIEQAQHELEAGTIYVNDTGVFYPQVPYQGLKMSGVGVESGKHGIWEFVNKKHLHVNLSQQKTKDYWFPY